MQINANYLNPLKNANKTMRKKNYFRSLIKEVDKYKQCFNPG